MRLFHKTLSIKDPVMHQQDSMNFHKEVIRILFPINFSAALAIPVSGWLFSSSPGRWQIIHMGFQQPWEAKGDQ